MDTVVADLHVHTDRSDGDTSTASLSAIAADEGLSMVAITDHDRLPPKEIPQPGATVIPGLELRVEAEGIGRVDLLGYGVDRSDARLKETIDRLQADRIQRARVMRERLESTLDVEIDLELSAGIGRPHLAHAVAERTTLSYQEVFERYIGEGDPCYVPRSVPTFGRGRRLLRSACRLVVLAHPMRYDDPRAALPLVDELDGVEFYYPYGDQSTLEELEGLLQSGTLRTGGSDAHTRDAIGTTGLDRGALAPVARRLGIEVD